MKLNLGCGPQVLDGWINVDYALGARFMKVPFFRTLNRKLKLFNIDWHDNIYLHNLTKPLPWPDSSVDIIYSSHTLEHFSRDEGRQLLAECHRVLCENGILRIVVPDLRHDVRRYIDGITNAEDFIEELGVLFGSSNNPVKNRLAPFYQFPHKCMYDNDRMVAIFDAVGFDASTRLAFDSDIKDIKQIELESRTEHAVIVEGRKRPDC